MATGQARTKKPRKAAKSKARQMPWRTSEAIGVGFFVLAVAVLAALISSQPFTDVMQQALGRGAYLVPALLAGMGVILARSLLDKTDEWRWREIVGAVALFVVAVALMHLLVASRAANEGGGWLGQLVVKDIPEGASPLLIGLGLGEASPWLVGLGLAALGVVGAFLALSLPPRLAWRTAVLLGVTIGKGLRFTAASVVEVLTAAFNAAKPAPAAAHARSAPAANTAAPASRTLPPPPVVRPIVVNGPVQAGSTTATEAKKPETVQQTLPLPPTTPPVAPGKWVLPQIGLLEKPEKQSNISEADIREKVSVIEETLAEFNIDARVVEVNPGPVITQFGIEPGFHERRDRLGNVTRRERVKVAEITALKDDLALALAARAIRIEAPVPGRSVIGIEVPNGIASIVNLRNCMDSESFRKLSAKAKLAVALGQDVLGDVVCADVAKTPHLLIAGSTGAGKSVCINALVSCLLMQNTPEDLKLILIDPKRVELTVFNDIPHLLRPVVVEIDRVISVLQWVAHEMESRHKRFELFGVRNIDGYNKKIGKTGPALPYIAIIIDELAHVM